MKLKIIKENRYNKIDGENSTFKNLFKKVNKGLSDGELKKIEIYHDHISIYVGEKKNDKRI